MWQDIPGCEGYQADKSGHIRNKNTRYILKPHVNDQGYLRICLTLKGKNGFHMVHVLVATAYLDNPNNLPDVNHKNNKRQDNRVCNLEWVSHSDNIKQIWISGAWKHKRAKSKLDKRRKNNVF